jgi:aldose sugar dehydrogenase
MYLHLHRIVGISLSFLLCLSYSVTGNSNAQPTSFVPSVNDNNLKVEPVITGLDRPVSIAFLGPNDMLVVERNTGIVHRVTDGQLMKEPLLDVNVFTGIESGMLGIETAKNNDGKMFVFLYYTEAQLKDGDDPKKNIGNRLYRYELINNKLVNPKLLLAVPKGSGSHNGGAIKLGPDGNLYVPVGDLSQYDFTGVSNATLAQNIQNGSRPNLSGGILRMTQDGRSVGGIIRDSFPESLYFAYGIRNSFGIDFDPITGTMWDTENGPSFGDEINIVRPGFNSGWIQVQGIWHPDFGEGWVMGQPFNKSGSLVDFDGKGKYSSPEFIWQDTVAPTAIKFLTSPKLGSQYENDIFVGDIKYGRLYHFDLNKNRTALQLNGTLSDKVWNGLEDLTPVLFGQGFAGISDLEVGPDGYLYVVSYAHVCTASTGQELSEGRIYKISPKTALTNVSNNTSVPSNTSYNSSIIGNITTSNAPLNLSVPTTGNHDAILPVENKTYWSTPLPVNATYIEGSFRIMEDENETSKDKHAGLVWKEGNNKTYYAFVRPGPKLISLVDSENEISCASLIAENVDLNKITIINSPESIYVYHNDLLRIKVPREFNGTNISPVGIRTHNTEAEFDPIKVGQFPQNLSQFLLPDTALTVNENSSISIKTMVNSLH